MANAFNKEIIRSITHSLGRFIAIAAIVALGCGFYAGLCMTEPDMKLAADAYYDGTELEDIRVVSTLGLTDKDIESLRGLEGEEAVMPAYEVDAMATINSEQYAVRIHSLPDSASQSVLADAATVESGDENYLNRPVLVEGSWPTSSGECVVSIDRVMNAPTQVGDQVVLTHGSTSLKKTLKTRTYTIVGYVHSPYYVSSTSMGTTTLGSGTVQQFLYIPQNDFKSDRPYTEAFITVKGAKDEMAGSEEYQALVDRVVDEIEELAPEREQARLDSLKSEAQDELDEKRANFEDEKADARKELDNARRELDKAADTISSSEKKLAEAQSQIEKNDAKLQKSQKAYDRGVQKLADQKKQAEKKFAQAERNIQSNEDQLAAQEEQLAQSEEELEKNKAAVDEGLAMLPELEGSLEKAEQALKTPGLPAEQKAALEAQRDELKENIAKIQAASDEWESASEQVEQGKAALASGKEQIKDAKARLKQERKSAEKKFAAAQAKLDKASKELESGASQLAEAKSQYEQGKSDLESGRHAYSDNIASYNEAADDARKEFAKAESKLDKAQSKINKIELPEWLVMDRTKNYGVVSFDSDADRIAHIAQVFPLVFFLVAALVALTTMTRMVEEERILIGTYKALGYSRARITSKYLIYALAASLGGASVGIAIMSYVLPMTIMHAYSIIYYVPPASYPIDLPIAFAATLLGVGVTLIATWAAAAATLHEQPARLMLPRAPKAGKRILLERITLVWKHLSFSWKVTMRNLFRYKKRLLMTTIGIAGCTALLLTGLGLQDSINDIIDKQYGELVNYNVVVDFKDGDTADKGQKDIEELMEQSTRAQNTALVAVAEGRTDLSLRLIVPQDSAAFGGLWDIRNRLTKEPLELSSYGVVITEKLANLLGVHVGDVITLAEQDEIGNASTTRYEIPITAIAENYVGNYVFMNESLYQNVFEESPEYTAYFGKIGAGEQEHKEFGDKARSLDGVKTVAFNDETIDAYRTMLRSVNMIVIVLVVAAALLAFIVLYNLTNINITERVREIATLKVLGFTRREVDMYIYRETILLSLLGALVGLVFGVFLESFVIVTAEVDQVMFGRDIHTTSFVLALVLTLVFTVIVMLVMRPKLNAVDMVESLKSNE